jgi:MFS transporter, DHA1 family, multidrug resistance protein
MKDENQAKLLSRLIPVLVIISMIGPLALNIVMPSMLNIARDLDALRLEVQLILSLFLASQAVSQLFVGALADRFGRRPVLLISLGLYLAASIAATFATSILLLVIARIFQAIGSTAGLTISRTVVRDLAHKDLAASTIGYVTAGMIIAPLLAPIIGGQVDDAFGWRAIFAVCLALGIVATVMSYWQLPETRPASVMGQGMSEVLTRSFALYSNTRFLAYAFGASFTSSVFFTFLGGAPYLVLDLLGMSKLAYGLWFISLSAGYLIGNVAAGKLSVRMGGDKMMHYGNVIGLSGAALFLLLAAVPVMTPWAVFIPLFITSMGNGILLPNAIAAAVSVDPKAAGTASGAVGFLQMGMGAILSYVAGQITLTSHLPMALIMFTSATLGWLSLSWVRRVNQQAPATHPPTSQ